MSFADGPTSDAFEHGLSRCSASFRISVVALRRKLWILNARLHSLPAKVELVYRQSGEWVHVDEFEPCTRDGVGLAKKLLRGGKGLGCWPAKWNCARLRARADRAERRAVVAMNRASDSLSEAFEAVQQAACARIKAHDACRISDEATLQAARSRSCSQ